MKRIDMPKIKYCGIRTLKDVRSVNEIRPDYVGFVFAPGRKRTIGIEEAAKLKASLDPSIRTVGVFVDEDPENVAAIHNTGIIDIAQLHGEEDEVYITNLRKIAPNLRILKAFVIKNDKDVISAEESSADLVLFDSGKGSGKTFDLSLIREFQRPFFLAGGLSPENIEERILEAPDTLWGLDVSSGIETDGEKDPEKMMAFMKNVKKAI